MVHMKDGRVGQLFNLAAVLDEFPLYVHTYMVSCWHPRSQPTAESLIFLTPLLALAVPPLACRGLIKYVRDIFDLFIFQ